MVNVNKNFEFELSFLCTNAWSEVVIAVRDISIFLKEKGKLGLGEMRQVKFVNSNFPFSFKKIVIYHARLPLPRLMH